MFARLTSAFIVLVVVTSTTAAPPSADVPSCRPDRTLYCCGYFPSDGSGAAFGCDFYGPNLCGNTPACCQRTDPFRTGYGCIPPGS